MKREEIKVGQDYLLSTSPDWEYGHYRNERVRVHDTRAWMSTRWPKRGGSVSLQSGENLATDRGFMLASNGRGGVLVEYLSHSGETLGRAGIGSRRFDVKEPRYIRGLWEEADARIQKNQAARDKAREEADRKSREASRRKDAVCEALRALGVKADPGTYASVRISVSDAEALVQRLRDSVNVAEMRTGKDAL